MAESQSPREVIRGFVRGEVPIENLWPALINGLHKKPDRIREALPELWELLGHTHPGVRDGAVLRIGELAAIDESLLPELERRLGDSANEVSRAEAAHTIGYTGKNGVALAGKLVPMLAGSEASEVRYRAAQAISRLATHGYSEAARVLEGLREDSDAKVRRVCKQFFDAQSTPSGQTPRRAN